MQVVEACKFHPAEWLIKESLCNQKVISNL